MPSPVQFLSHCLPYFLTLCDAGSMEALTELTEAQAAITCTCTILVSLSPYFLTLCDVGSIEALTKQKQRPKLPSPVQFLSHCSPYFLTLCDAGSMEALTEQTEAQAATTCTFLVLLFNLFFNPLRYRQHGGSNRANRS